MTDIQSKNDIIRQLENVSDKFSSFCSGISNELFFRQPIEKWSVAQNVIHLITSANMTRLAYRLVAKYKYKLEQGGRASGRFVAKPVSQNNGKENILDNFNKSMRKLINALQTKWDDKQLDKYLAPHPLLGKITLRELSYFTIYHTEHHLLIIKERLAG